MKLQDILWTAFVAIAAVAVARRIPGLKDMI